MYENVEISCGMGQIEEFPFTDYFALSELKGEFVILINEISTFYFICTNNHEFEKICKAKDWYIVSKSKFNDNLIIGIGLAGKESANVSAYSVRDEATFSMWRDILLFTFDSEFIRLFFPYNNFFMGKERYDNSLCFYIHDYYPVSHKNKITVNQKKVSNLVFRFKEGKISPLIAKIFSLAIGRMPFLQDSKNAVLIPIPASTQEKNRLRFESFCEQLTRRIGVVNGYEAIRITHDREPMKGLVNQDKLSNLSFNPELFAGRDVFLIDDILTTGSGFIQIKRKLMELGAKSVIGLFLGKTVEH